MEQKENNEMSLINEKQINKNKKKDDKKTLSPKVDYIFQKLFGEVGSENITTDLLETILEKNIKEIDLSEDIVLRREMENDKLGVLDVLAKIEGNEYCNIELQMAEKSNIIERILYYWSRIFIRNIKKGEDYPELKKTIAVLIADFKIDELEGEKYHTKWKIIEEKYRKKILTDYFEVHIIELNKAREIGKEDKEIDKLLKWLEFLENPEGERVKEYMKEEKAIKEAKEKLDEMSKDPKIRRIAELREKAIMDEKAAERFGYNKGKADGENLGYSKGKADGENLGYTNGKLEEKLNLAKKMKEKNIEIDLIMEITNLSKAEIEKL